MRNALTTPEAAKELYILESVLEAELPEAARTVATLEQQASAIAEERVQHNNMLLALDLTTPHEEQPDALKEAALASHMATCKIDDLERQKQAHANRVRRSGRNLLAILGDRKVRVEATDPERSPIERFKCTNLGRVAVSRRPKSVIGKLQVVDLDPAVGGVIELKGRFGRQYLVYPLVGNDYEPAVKVTLL